MSIQSNLYPPIIQTYMPAFDVNEKEFKIYFSLSELNSFNDIQYIPQVSITNQKTNKNVFKNDNIQGSDTVTVCNGIYFPKNGVQIDSSVDTEYKYYIVVDNNGFEAGEYYKVQIRFTNSSIGSTKPTSKNAAQWLETNAPYFSEWSTVCIIRAINIPTVDIDGYDFHPVVNSGTKTVYQSRSSNMIGKAVFQDNKDKLKSYRIKLRDRNNSKVLEDSGMLYPESLNQIYYDFIYAFQSSIEYIIELTLFTQSAYEITYYSNFIAISSGIDALPCTVVATAEDEFGRIKIEINNDTTIFNNYITIRRASDKNNYTTWEDVHTKFIEFKSGSKYIWYDYTAESGTYYKYYVQKRRSRDGARGAVYDNQISLPVILYLDSLYLNGDNKQLKVKYNGNISSMSINVMENKTETLGSKYPFITRNGNTYYKQYSLSGLITVQMDKYDIDSINYHNGTTTYPQQVDHMLFIKQNNETECGMENLFTSNETFLNYKNYSQKYDIYPEYNRTYEKKFREKVLEFLYNENPKLLRSADEGAVIVKLMDVNLTPNSVLNGLIYDFSATAIEIDEYNPKNCDLYNIQTINELNVVKQQTVKIGQIIDTFTQDTDVLHTVLEEKYYENYSNEWNTYVDSLFYMKITFLSPPYLIGENKNNEIFKIGKVVKTVNDFHGVSYNTLTGSPIGVGYIIKVNGENIFIPATSPSYNQDNSDNPNVLATEWDNYPKNIPSYTVGGDNIRITSLSFEDDTNAEIDYIVNLKHEEKLDNKFSFGNEYTVGQIWQVFSPYQSIKDLLLDKHFIWSDEYYRTICSIDGIEIEADPGVVVDIKESFDTAYNRHIINNTGTLIIHDDNTTIVDAHVVGRRFYKNNIAGINVPYNCFKYVGTVPNRLGLQPKTNELYFDELFKAYFFYYNNQWIKIDGFNDETDEYIDIEVPVEAMVNYLYTLEKGVYV